MITRLKLYRYRSFSCVLSYSDEVAQALRARTPIVALESTIISHGMPYPRSLDVARTVEDAVRRHGAVPATIGILNGLPKIGMNTSELATLANAKENRVLKAARRDLAYVVSKGLNAATTVSSTMIFAHRAGIRVFATGGIGGVHRGGETSMDISSDLTELARTPIAVVCSGAKAILDIPRTLEVLETYGVPVLGYQTDKMPAFYTNDIGISCPLRADNSLDVARHMMCQDLLEMKAGMVIAVPNLKPMNAALINSAISEALAEIKRLGITGPATTPFLLAAVSRATDGTSLESNIALVCNNAGIAAEIAVEHSRMSKGSKSSWRGCDFTDKMTRSSVVMKENETFPVTSAEQKQIVVIGGAVMDTVVMPTSKPLVAHTSNPGTRITSHGGVARNIAEGIANVVAAFSAYHVESVLVAAVGNDAEGTAIVRKLLENRVNVLNVLQSALHRTAAYVAVHDFSGDLHVAVAADMDVTHELVNEELFFRIAPTLKSAAIVVADGNLSSSALFALTELCCASEVPVFFEPTSAAKCINAIVSSSINNICFMKPNLLELRVMCAHMLGDAPVTPGETRMKAAAALTIANSTVDDEVSIDCIADMSRPLLELMHNHSKWGKHILTSIGRRGLAWMTFDESGEVISRVIDAVPLPKSDKSVHTSGAGDAFCSGFVFGLVHGPSITNWDRDAALLAAIKLGLMRSNKHIVSQ